MKIVVISPDSHRLHEIASILTAYQVTLLEGGPGQLHAVTEKNKPDLIVLDGSGDPADLAQLECATGSFAQPPVVLLCPTPTREFLLGAMRAGEMGAMSVMKTA